MNTSTGAKANDAADQRCRSRNVESIVDFYRSGATSARGRVGIELEHFVVHKNTGLPLRYSEPHGTAWLLERLSDDYPERSFEGESLIGLSRTHDGVVEAITLEPAAQVELSAGPFDSLAAADRCFGDFEAKLTSLADEVGAEVARVGYQPAAVAADTELIPKQRYHMMDRYLGGLSAWGPRMMRGTTSAQVSIDYADEQDCLRKLRLADALVPVLSLVCDNSPVFEGKPRPHRMMRTEVWEKLDPGRSGIAPGVMEPGFTLERMAEHVLDTPAITVPDGRGGLRYDTRTFGQVYADEPMDRDDVVHAVSMLFNDVRLKSYIEVRPADAMPIPHTIAYAALLKGLFSSEASLDAMDGLFAEAGDADVTAAKHSLERDGYDGQAYGRDVAGLADRLFEIARAGLPDDEQHFLDPLAKLVTARTTLADVWEQEHAE